MSLAPAMSLASSALESVPKPLALSTCDPELVAMWEVDAEPVALAWGAGPPSYPAIPLAAIPWPAGVAAAWPAAVLTKVLTMDQSSPDTEPSPADSESSLMSRTSAAKGAPRPARRAKSSMSKFMRRVGFAFMLATQAAQLNWVQDAHSSIWASSLAELDVWLSSDADL